MAAARLADPEKHALVCAKHPVKTSHQLDHIRRAEIPVGLHPQRLRRRRPKGLHLTNELGAPATLNFEIIEEPA